MGERDSDAGGEICFGRNWEGVKVGVSVGQPTKGAVNIGGIVDVSRRLS